MTSDVDPGAITRWLGPDLVERADGVWRLVGSACHACGARYFPQTTTCPACMGRDLGRVHLSEKGRLHSVTTVAVAPPGFQAPYRLGWVDLDNGPRVFGQIVPADGNEPRTGADMTVSVAPIRVDPDGTPVYGHVFTSA
ncbi:MAG: Zn-ribbon domain-containing OB-fold protein [Actinomycetota bacterium]